MRVSPLLVMLALALRGVASGQLSLPPADELEQAIRRAEKEGDGLALAIARAQRGRARGEVERAAREWRPVLEKRAAEVERVRKEVAAGRFCGSVEEYEFPQGQLALARAWLAEVEGRPDDLRAELPGVIRHLETAIRRNRMLRERNAITEKEQHAANRLLEEDLRWARLKAGR